MTAVIRPVWVPSTRAQRDALVKVAKAGLAARRAEREMWEAIIEARDLGVPDEELCRQSKASRATLNRHFGSRTHPRRPDWWGRPVE